MANNFKSEGRSVTWTNSTGSDVASGDVVVIGNQIGVAMVDIADTETGTVAMEGVFSIAKKTGASEAIDQGTAPVWDSSEGEFAKEGTTPASGDVSNAVTCWEDAGDNDTTVLVKLNTSLGTVT